MSAPLRMVDGTYAESEFSGKISFYSEALMFRLKSIGVLSAANISALLYGGLALLLVPIFLSMAVYVTVTSDPTPNQPPGTFI